MMTEPVPNEPHDLPPEGKYTWGPETPVFATEEEAAAYLAEKDRLLQEAIRQAHSPTTRTRPGSPEETAG